MNGSRSIIARSKETGFFISIEAILTLFLPGIKLLILPSFNKISCFLGESFKTTDSDRPFWPELDGLAVRDIDDEGVLYEFVQDRQRLGVPLRSLYLDPLSMSRMTRMDWLKDQLSVVEADPWKIQRQGTFYCNEEDRFLGAEK